MLEHIKHLSWGWIANTKLSIVVKGWIANGLLIGLINGAYRWLNILYREVVPLVLTINKILTFQKKIVLFLFKESFVTHTTHYPNYFYTIGFLPF